MPPCDQLDALQGDQPASGHSRGPVEVGGRGVGIGFARELHVHPLQVPVPIKPLDGHLRLVCGTTDVREGEVRRAGLEVRERALDREGVGGTVTWLELEGGERKGAGGDHGPSEQADGGRRRADGHRKAMGKREEGGQSTPKREREGKAGGGLARVGRAVGGDGSPSPPSPPEPAHAAPAHTARRG